MASHIAAQQKAIERLLKGLNHQKSGEFEKAQRCYQQALKKDPNNPEALNLMGVISRQLGYPKRAIDYLQRAIARNPAEPSFHTNLAHAMLVAGADADDLLAACAKALSLDQWDRDARNIKGIALTNKGQFSEAEQLYKSLVIEFPDFVDAYLNYGLLMMKAGQAKQAVGFFAKAIAIDCGNPVPIIQLARARLALEQYEQSQAELAKALERFPDNGDIAHEAARVFFSVNEPDKALPYARQAIRSDPHNHHKALTLGSVYLMNRQAKEALETLLLARKNAPADNRTIDWNLSLAYLANGDLKNGWALHKARFEDETTQARERKFDVPAWAGEDISDKTILVWSDQGLGDVLRAGTMLPELVARAKKVIIETPEKAAKFIQYSFPQTTCRSPAVDKDLRSTLSDYDLHTNITDLVDFFRPDVNSFKRASVPAYSFETGRAKDYLTRLKGHDTKPVIGISWRSNKLTARRARFYLSALDLAPVLDSRDAIFVNLQYKTEDEEIAFLREQFADRFNVFEDVDLFDDLPGAAALTAACDFVVSANTSVADMAGLMNVPSIRFGQPEATLNLGQDNPPWYPSMTYMHPYTDRPCADFVPEIIGEMNRQLENWTPDLRNQRLGL